MGVSKFRGIIIKDFPIGEADKILTFFTKENGKSHARVKGARRVKSKYMAGSHVFTYGDFVMFSGSSFNSITQIDVIENFYGLRMDYNKFAYGSLILEIIDKSTFENLPNEDLLRLILKTFKKMNGEKADLKIILSVFIFKYLEFNGYIPETKICINCNKEYDKNNVFFGKEGVLCFECKNIDREARRIAYPAIFAIDYIVNADIREIFRFKLDKEYVENLKTASEIFLMNLDLNLKSKSIVDEYENI